MSRKYQRNLVYSTVNMCIKNLLTAYLVTNILNVFTESNRMRGLIEVVKFDSSQKNIALKYKWKTGSVCDVLSYTVTQSSKRSYYSCKLLLRKL